MGPKLTVHARIVEAMRATTLDQEQVSSETMGSQAAAAQIVVSEVIVGFCEALVSACVRMDHRGCIPAMEGRAGKACPRCQVKVRHFREAASLIGPEDFK